MEFTRSIGGNEAPSRTLLSMFLFLASVLALVSLQAQDITPPVAASTMTAQGDRDAEVITPQRLSEMMDSAKVYVFDCNEADVFSDGHVPGAVLTVYDAVNEEGLPKDHHAVLAFYCYNPECPAGATAARTALRLGFDHVYCMLAGITGWQDAKLRTEP